MKPLTAEEIAELRRLESKATEAPWVEEEGEAELHSPEHRVVFAADMDDADRQFIAAARNALPRLLNELERSRALLKRIEWMGSAYPDASDMPCCPACDSQHKHEPDCELAALLATE
jgi:hypothetical protein